MPLNHRSQFLAINLNIVYVSSIWRRKRQPTPAFLPGEFHGQKSQVRLQSRGHRVRHDWLTLSSSSTSWVREMSNEQECPQGGLAGFSSVTRSFNSATPWTAARQASLSITNSQFTPMIPFSSSLQSSPASGSSMSQFFVSGGQSIGVSASRSVLPMNIQDWFPLGWTGWLSLQRKRLSAGFKTQFKGFVSSQGK